VFRYELGSNRGRFKAPNPSSGLLIAFGDAGVTIYICGQMAAYRGHMPGDVHPAVSMAELAVIVNLRLQSKGYM
jgi:hypothetical protein